MKTPKHIIIDGDAISIRPSEVHEYLVTTKEVARGYGVSEALIRKHKERHADELLTSTHWTTVTNSHGGEPATLWTKLGVITLGFFIRSERAKRFRAAAAQLILRISTGESGEVKRSDIDALAQGFAALSKTVQHMAELQGRMMLGQQKLQAGEENLRFGQSMLALRVSGLERRTFGFVHGKRDPEPGGRQPRGWALHALDMEHVAEDLARLLSFALGQRMQAAVSTAELLSLVRAHDLLHGHLSPVSPKVALGILMTRLDGKSVGGIKVQKYRTARRRSYILSRGVTSGAN
jgi:hypothetical protein